MSRTFILAAAAFAVTAAVYLPCARFSYVPLDDFTYVVENANLRGGLTAESAKWAFTSQRYASNCEWHPVAWLSMLLDVSLSGGSGLSDEEWGAFDNRVARTMHLHNVLLHAPCAALLFLLMARFCRGRLDEVWALGLALLWALHPLRTEVVCWISERKELLSVMFMLLTMILYVRGVVGSRSRTVEISNSIVHLPLFSTTSLYYVFSLLTFTFSLLSKPVAVTLPAVLLAWDWVFGRRVRVLRLVPFALASLVTCHMTIVSQQGALETGRGLDALARMTAIFGAPVVYLRQTFWPVGLSASYPDAGGWAAGLLIGLGAALVAALAACCVRWLFLRLARPSRPTPLLDILVFAVAWVYIGLVPMLGIVKVGGETHSDRYTYWVGCGAVAAVALLLAERGRAWREALGAWVAKTDGRPFDWPPVRRFVLWGIAVTLVVLSVMTRQRAEVWRTPLAFLRGTLEVCASYAWAEKLEALARKKAATDDAEVEYWYRECARRMPCVEAHVSLARFLLSKPVAEDGLDRGTLYAEPKLILDSVLAADPDNRDARELLDRIDDIRNGR